MNDRYNYRGAVLDDGRYVLYEVIKRLYQGDNLRPDIFFQREPKLQRINYNSIFNREQRSMIEQSGLSEAYDIADDARYFDVSLLATLIEHTCGLSAHDSLLEKVNKVKLIRNKVAHPDDSVYQEAFYQSNDNENQKLMELLKLYVSIIDDLEEMTCENLYAVKSKIENLIRRRTQTIPTTHGKHNNESESDEMPTWGKVALGAAFGVAALGALLKDNADKEERRRREQSWNHTGSYGQGDGKSREECIVM